MEHFPRATYGRVDCDRVGPLVTAGDASHDVAFAMADLRRIGVAATADALCVEWTVASPIRRPYLAVFQAYDDDPRHDLSVEVSVPPDEPPNIGSGSWGAIDGRVDLHDRSLSVLVTRDAITDASTSLLTNGFEFDAAVRRHIRQDEGSPLAVDPLGYGRHRPVYP